MYSGKMRGSGLDFIFLALFILAALGLHCCMHISSSCSDRGLLFIAVHNLHIVVASLVMEDRHSALEPQ